MRQLHMRPHIAAGRINVRVVPPCWYTGWDHHRRGLLGGPPKSDGRFRSRRVYPPTIESFEFVSHEGRINNQ